MSEAAERDIPTLDELATDCDAQIARLDKPSPTPLTAEAVMDEIKNTLLPLMKDIAMSANIGLIFVQDLADPIKLTGGEAEENAALLKALAASRPTDEALQGRVQAMLEVLEDDDETDEEEEPQN